MQTPAATAACALILLDHVTAETYTALIFTSTMADSQNTSTGCILLTMALLIVIFETWNHLWEREMTNAEIIGDYFKRFFSGKARHSEVRSLLTDDFKFRDPLMSANSADEYVNQLKAFGDVLDMHADVREIVGGSDTVAALVDFDGPAGRIAYSEWFTFRNGKIAALQVIYDPRPFLDGPPKK